MLLLFSLLLMIATLIMVSGAAASKPGYEPAYVNGKTVLINAIDVPPNAPAQAQADF